MTKLNVTQLHTIRQEHNAGATECFVSEEIPPLIKPGEYDMVLSNYRTELFFGKQPKLVMLFKIIGYGEAFELILPLYYNVLEIKGKPSKRGAVKIGKRSNFLRDFCTLFPDVNIRRMDRIPMSYFEGVIIRGKVDSVTQDSKQNLIPKQLQYSKVSKLLKVVA